MKLLDNSLIRTNRLRCTCMIALCIVSLEKVTDIFLFIASIDRRSRYEITQVEEIRLEPDFISGLPFR